ncbi:MAG: aminoglycoside phosphotransferase family protein [bacterium]
MDNQTHTTIDSKLPLLQTVLDESWMRAFFQNHLDSQLNGSRRKLTGCKIVDKRYKPGRRCLVTYQLDFAEISEPQIWHSCIQTSKTLVSETADISLQPASDKRGSGIEVWPFPAEPELGCLLAASPPAVVQKTLANLGAGSQCVTTRLLKYVPRRHGCLAVSLDNSEQVFCKIYFRGSGSPIYSVMRQLYQQTRSPSSAFSVAEPLTCKQDGRLLFLRWQDGWSFLRFAREKGLEYACHLTAIALAAFHQSRLNPLPPFTQEDSLRKTTERAQMLWQFHPDFQTPAEALLQRLHELLPTWPPAQQTPIHGDFNYSQILFDFEKPVFIDFDSVSVGDPLHDLAHFVAGLYHLSARRYFSAAEIRLVVGLFISTYKKFAPGEISESALNGQIAMALISRRAFKVLRQLQGNPIEEIEFYLNLARQYLN